MHANHRQNQNMWPQKQTLLWVIVAVCLIHSSMAGCSGTRLKTSYYVLSPISAETSPLVFEKSRGAIGIGPIRLPKYLNRPEILSRVGRNAIQFSDDHRWAEPLHENVSRVIGENLSRLLGQPQTVRYPWKRSADIRLQIKIDFQRLEVENNFAVLNANWSIIQPPQSKSQNNGRFSEKVPLGEENYAGKVAALNQALDRFSDHLARELAGFVQHRKHQPESS